LEEVCISSFDAATRMRLRSASLIVVLIAGSKSKYGYDSGSAEANPFMG
jgi:hypothetical protein